MSNTKGHTWIVQQQGIHKYRMGEPVEVFINPSLLYVFEPDGRLAAAPQDNRPTPH